MKHALLGLVLAMSIVGSAAEASPAPPAPAPRTQMHVGLCGATTTTTERDVALRIVKLQGQLAGDQAIRTYFSAHQEKARLSLDASSGTLHLEGTITEATVRALAGALQRQPAPRQLVVNSFGGQARAGMAMADLIRRHQVGLTVRGFCMSACAIYLLPAARELRLDDAVIGLHGSPSACREQLSTWTGIRQWGLSNYLEFLKVARLDADFAAGTPRMSEAIALSQRPDRGAMDGAPRDWLIVTPSRAERLGLRVVSMSSTQTFDLIAGDAAGSLIGSVHVY